jgi:inward rectifier potassium channel
MATQKHIHKSLNENTNTGFGTNTGNSGRWLNKDGSFNMRKEGINFFNRFSVFQTMLNIPTWKFIGVILIFYVVINLAFTGVYLLVGISQMEGMRTGSPWIVFKEFFFFSTQTFTTVGYGRINPVGGWANLIAAAEALSGFLSFAIVTGLIYGRFAKPKSYLVFSHNALVSPYHGHTGLMFRLACYKDNHNLTDVEVIVNLGLRIQEGEKRSYKYYTLPLERSRIESLPMNWTIVHPIDDKSPLHGLSAENIQEADAELYILIRAYDDVFSSIVQQRTSYVYSEILFDRKFVPMYQETGATTIIDLGKLNEHKEAKAGVHAV